MNLTDELRTLIARNLEFMRRDEELAKLMDARDRERYELDVDSGRVAALMDTSKAYVVDAYVLTVHACRVRMQPIATVHIDPCFTPRST